MKKIIFGTFGYSPALVHARNQLQSWGYEVSQTLTGITHLLLPVPSLDETGNVRGGGPIPQLEDQVRILGGNLAGIPGNKVDFLQDEYYLEENAAITAQCAATRLANPAGKQVLIVGLGRIGRVLGILLRQAGADITMAVRSREKAELAERMAFTAVMMEDLAVGQFDAIFNTAPTAVIRQEDARADALLVDLASKRGILGDRVEWALALPGKEAPLSSGTLIAKTALRYALKKEEQL